MCYGTCLATVHPVQYLLGLCLSVLTYWVIRPASDVQIDFSVQPQTCIITWKLTDYLDSWLNLGTTTRPVLFALCGDSGAGCWPVRSLPFWLLLHGAPCLSGSSCPSQLPDTHYRLKLCQSCLQCGAIYEFMHCILWCYVVQFYSFYRCVPICMLFWIKTEGW